MKPSGPLVVVGAAGDLVLRHLLPALALLEQRDALADLQILALDRRPDDGAGYRVAAIERIRAVRPQLPAEVAERLARRLDYRCLDVTVADRLPGPAPGLVHLALPPDVLVPAAALVAATPGQPRTVMVEKPYGRTGDEAARLDRAWRPQDLLLRADHMLHHGSVRDLDRYAARLATLLPHLAAVRVRWDEPAGLGVRAPFFDGVGALRDMVQSHLLQVLATVLAGTGPGVTGQAARAARAAVLAAIQTPTLDLVGRSVRGRYVAGPAPDGPPDYVAEPGVRPGRATETFVSVRLEVARSALVGGPDRPGGPSGMVPVEVTTGKAVGTGVRRVELDLTGADVARVRLDLGGEQLRVCEDGRPVSLPGPPAGADGLPASARQFLAARAGRVRWFVGPVECGHMWRITDAIRGGWARLDTPLLDYEAGSAGPSGVAGAGG